MIITAIKYGETTLPESMVFENGKEETILPISLAIYLIETKNRKILVDAGCDTMPGFTLSHFIGPVRALQMYGVNPEDITDVVITHSHHDHIESVGKFPNATVYIHKAEYEEGKRYIPETMQVCLFEDTYPLTENILIKRVGGHSEGSSVVLATVEKTVYVFAGDACYTEDCITRKIPTGASVCPEESRAFIEIYGKSPYCVLTCHDIGITEKKHGWEKITQ